MLHTPCHWRIYIFIVVVYHPCTEFASDRGKIIFRKLKIKISSFFAYFIEKLNDWNKLQLGKLRFRDKRNRRKPQPQPFSHEAHTSTLLEHLTNPIRFVLRTLPNDVFWILKSFLSYQFPTARPSTIPFRITRKGTRHITQVFLSLRENFFSSILLSSFILSWSFSFCYPFSFYQQRQEPHQYLYYLGFIYSKPNPIFSSHFSLPNWISQQHHPITDNHHSTSWKTIRIFSSFEISLTDRRGRHSPSSWIFSQTIQKWIKLNEQNQKEWGYDFIFRISLFLEFFPRRWRWRQEKRKYTWRLETWLKNFSILFCISLPLDASSPAASRGPIAFIFYSY